MWIRTNLNPKKQNVGDCVIRAIAMATNKSWYEVYDDLCAVGRKEADMPSSNTVWGLYLYQLGFEPFLLPNACPKCMTIRDFTKRFPQGTYIIGTGTHAVAIIEGDFYDSYDSGSNIVSYFWRVA
jgi:hypothetical protein